jgi:hypothetical protein
VPDEQEEEEEEEEDLRIDPSDGLLYCKADFLAEYGGTVEWDAAVRAKPQADEPLPAQHSEPNEREEEQEDKEQEDDDDDELVPEPEPLPSYPLYVSGSESDEPEPEPAAILYGDGGAAYGSDQSAAASAELVQLLTDMGFGKNANLNSHVCIEKHRY